MSALALLAAALVTAAPMLDHEPVTLHSFVGGGYLGSPGGHGVSAVGGVRVGLPRHVAVGFDVSYGTLSSIQDRWSWMPSVAFVVTLNAVRLDFGAGLGIGTATGFSSWNDYTHDRTLWSAEYLPTVRGHAIAAVKVTPDFELFGRVDLSSQLLEGNNLGKRLGDSPTQNAQTMWLNLSLGVQFHVL